ncbi:MAG: hypothetical protein R3B84_00090 [Zavarzinella sp.]
MKKKLVLMITVMASFGAEPKTKEQSRNAIPALMRKTHMTGRQVYRSLDQRLISGRSTAEERALFIANYRKLRELTPPQGSLESWRNDIDQIISIAAECDDAKKDPASKDPAIKLSYAINCQACHEKYAFKPDLKPNEQILQSIKDAETKVATGGTNWSAPEALKEVGIYQPGRRLLLWPEKISFPQQQGDAKPGFAIVKFRWVLRPGAELPEGSPERFFYNVYDINTKKILTFQFAPHGGIKAREGSFTINITIPKESKKIAFVLLTNWTVNVPLGNLILFEF